MPPKKATILADRDNRHIITDRGLKAQKIFKKEIRKRL
jgi:hypothetical protein